MGSLDLMINPMRKYERGGKVSEFANDIWTVSKSSGIIVQLFNLSSTKTPVG